jgi:catechol 2,3-dioxygenase-like lactoylglutathione lyase family enzyme
MIDVDDVVTWSESGKWRPIRSADDRINVPVRDLRRSVEFYGRVFGFHLVRGGFSESAAVIAAPTAKLVLHAKSDVSVRPGAARRWGLLVKDLDAAREEVWDLGVAIARDSGAPDQIFRRLNGRSLYVHDPDGNVIELVEVGGERTGDIDRASELAAWPRQAAAGATPAVRYHLRR